MAHGGKRIGSGRKPGVKLPEVSDQDQASHILDALERPERENDPQIIKRWRRYVNADEIGVALRADMFLFDHKNGKAVQPLDFNRPIEIVIDLDSAVTRRAAAKNK